MGKFRKPCYGIVEFSAIFLTEIGVNSSGFTAFCVIEISKYTWSRFPTPANWEQNRALIAANDIL